MSFPINPYDRDFNDDLTGEELVEIGLDEENEGFRYPELRMTPVILKTDRFGTDQNWLSLHRMQQLRGNRKQPMLNSPSTVKVYDMRNTKFNENNRTQNQNYAYNTAHTLPLKQVVKAYDPEPDDEDSGMDYESYLGLEPKSVLSNESVKSLEFDNIGRSLIHIYQEFNQFVRIQRIREAKDTMRHEIDKRDSALAIEKLDVSLGHRYRDINY